MWPYVVQGISHRPLKYHPPTPHAHAPPSPSRNFLPPPVPACQPLAYVKKRYLRLSNVGSSTSTSKYSCITNSPDIACTYFVYYNPPTTHHDYFERVLSNSIGCAHTPKKNTISIPDLTREKETCRNPLPPSPPPCTPPP